MTDLYTNNPLIHRDRRLGARTVAGAHGRPPSAKACAGVRPL